eukprot:Colp12_sorted_trinity150504_noHs@5325
MATNSTCGDTSGGAVDLSIYAVLYGACLMVINVIISFALKLKLEIQLVIATIRTVVQLLILGYLLTPIFSENKPYWSALLMMGMILLAAREAWAKPKYSYPWLFRDVLVSIFFPSVGILLIGLTAIIREDPWWDAQYMIPMMGMLLGNCLNGISLALNYCLTQFTTQKKHIEGLLARGATKWEAAFPVMQEALKTGMIPTINSLNIIGLVSIPGMMTGQILGGTEPQQAARYQMIIMFMIAATGVLGLVCAVYLAVHAVFDSHHRLLTDIKLVKRTGSIGDIFVWTFTAIKSAVLWLWRNTFGRCCRSRDKDRGEYQPIPTSEN